jgi:hypothetical protein
VKNKKVRDDVARELGLEIVGEIWVERMRPFVRECKCGTFLEM